LSSQIANLISDLIQVYYMESIVGNCVHEVNDIRSYQPLSTQQPKINIKNQWSNASLYHSIPYMLYSELDSSGSSTIPGHI